MLHAPSAFVAILFLLFATLLSFGCDIAPAEMDVPRAREVIRQRANLSNIGLPTTNNPPVQKTCLPGPDGLCVTEAGLECLMKRACTYDGKCLVGDDGECRSAPHFIPPWCEVGSCVFDKKTGSWKRIEVSEALPYDCDADDADSIRACQAFDWKACAKNALFGGDCPTFGQSYCLEQPRCRKAGLCTHVVETRHGRTRQRCTIKKDEDCARSSRCEDEGACAFKSKRCRVETTEHCEQARVCTEEGRCRPWDGKCQATEAGCANSIGCKEDGRCYLHYNQRYEGDMSARCIREPSVAFADRCAWECTEAGECEKEDGRCQVGENAHCAQSNACVEYGGCALVIGKHGTRRCRPSAPNHCLESAKCKESGACHLNRETNLCKRDDRGCRASRQCAVEGKCSLGANACEARSEKDCKASQRCREEGRCKLDPGRNICIKSARTPDVLCTMSKKCSEEGRCVANAAHTDCVVADLAYCEAAFSACTQPGAGVPVCEIEAGACALTQSFCDSPKYCKGAGAVCEPYPLQPNQRELCRVTALDCTRTEECSRYGRCREQNGRCVVDEKACKMSPRCKADGLCDFDSRSYSCVGHTDAFCREQRACKEEGRCVAADEESDFDDGCQAMLDRDCAASRACKERGACHVWAGRCVTKEEIPYECKDGKVLIDGACRRPAGYNCKRGKECKDFKQCEGTRQLLCTADGVCSKQKYTLCEAARGSDCVGALVCTDSYDEPGGTPGCSSRETKCERPGDCKVMEGGWSSTAHCSDLESVSRGCVPASACELTDGWCRRQPDCATEGHCGLAVSGTKGGDWLHCRATREEHCQRSEACKVRGDCALVLVSVLYACGPTRQEHCQNSELCETEGRCTFDGAGCSR